MKLLKLQSVDYATSTWSGGTTTQLAIAPAEASYAARDFLWRVSSATVELDASTFTALPDYERLITTLEGEIALRHNGGAEIRLRPGEVHAFSGADETRCAGRCTDFNLMLRRGRATGTMEALRLAPGETSAPEALREGETLLLYAAGGADWGPWAQAVIGILLIVLAVVLAVEGVQTFTRQSKKPAQV